MQPHQCDHDSIAVDSRKGQQNRKSIEIKRRRPKTRFDTQGVSIIMNQLKLHRFVITFGFVAVCSLLLAGGGYALESTSPTPKASMTLDIKPGNLTGTVFDVQGRPLTGVEITAKNSDGDVTYKAVTGDNGSYKLVGLGEGRYSLFIRGRSSGTLNITRKSKISSLKAVIPSASSRRDSSASGGGGSTPSDSKSTAIKTSQGYVIITDWNAQVSGPVGPRKVQPPGNVSP